MKNTVDYQEVMDALNAEMDGLAAAIMGSGARVVVQHVQGQLYIDAEDLDRKAAMPELRKALEAAGAHIRGFQGNPERKFRMVRHGYSRYWLNELQYLRCGIRAELSEEETGARIYGYR